MKLVAIVLGFSLVGLLITLLSAWSYDYECDLCKVEKERSRALEEERRARNSSRFSRHGPEGNLAGKTSS